MTDKIKEQLMVIRDSGLCNLFDVPCVRKIADGLGFIELIDFIDNNRRAYSLFILYGDDGE